MAVLNAGGPSLLNKGLLATFPETLWFNGAEYNCIAPPLELFKQLNPNTYDAKVTFTFQMKETVRATAGIGLRSVIFFETPYAAVLGKGSMLQFEVYAFGPDKNDSLVLLRCNLKQ